MTESNIALKSVKELLGMSFFIPSYQRGYRWTEQQVKDLLDDILEFSNKEKQGYEFYCLQPLVVKRKVVEVLERIKQAKSIEEVEALIKKGPWEVIDGQQRLTTIYILLSYLFPDQDKKYVLSYETRKNFVDFLNIIVATNDNFNKLIDNNIEWDNIDFYHIFIAHATISEWFGDDISKKEKFKNCLLDNVRFIWYESVDEDPIKVFTRLNIGKISLTNAELIKALFLNSSNFSEKDFEHFKLRQQEIASEWDNIEYTLQNDEFWLFLHETNYNRPTRIDFIFDLICDQKTLGNFENIGTDEYKTFRYFYEYFKSESSNIKDCWDKVKKYFQTFREWFDDLELYHYIGYLVVYNYSISGLVSRWYSYTDKGSFVQYLKVEIKKKIEECPTLDSQYEDGSNKGDCKPILLFHNIQTVINQNINNLNNEDYKLGVFYKFPFHLYKLERWDVEHINSNTTNEENDPTTQKEWLLNVYLSADDSTQQNIRSYFESTAEEEKEVLFEKIRKKFPKNDEWTQEDKNMIWNYTLLDSSTNRSYGNAIFSGKRRIIIGKDKGMSIAIPKISKNGLLQVGEDTKAKSSFVPPCTKQVFMKYYSATMTDANYWTKKVDAVGYLNDIKACINKLEE